VWNTTKNKKIRLLLVLVFCFAAQTARLTAASLEPFEAVEPHMGSLFRIKLYASNAHEAQSAFQAAFGRIAQLDNTLSDYKPDSELSRLSVDAIGHPVKVSSDLFQVVEAAQELAVESDGAFDITLGPVIRLWREARKTGKAPEEGALKQAAERCGYRNLVMDRAQQTIEFKKSGMQLDVGGIAKGYAADEALLVLSRLGIKSALVAASGDLAFSAAPPGKPGWRIGVDSFDAAQAPFTKVLELSQGAVSTSGDEEQHLDLNGKRYSHIIDPKTNAGLTRRSTVTVIARQGAMADALATTVSVLGPERGLELIRKHTDAAVLVLTQKPEENKVLESPNFPQNGNSPQGR
jgi:FAD:protein FMN transferase